RPASLRPARGRRPRSGSSSGRPSGSPFSGRRPPHDNNLRNYSQVDAPPGFPATALPDPPPERVQRVDTSRPPSAPERLMPVRFTVLASGSSGNASLVEAGGFGLLVDCGLRPRVPGWRLAAVGLSGRSVPAVVLSHTHGAHW